MTEKVRVQDCVERVAYDLAILIAHTEDTVKQDRDYWLQLMYECRLAAYGSDAQSIREMRSHR